MCVIKISMMTMIVHMSLTMIESVSRLARGPRMGPRCRLDAPKPPSLSAGSMAATAAAARKMRAGAMPMLEMANHGEYHGIGRAKKGRDHQSATRA